MPNVKSKKNQSILRSLLLKMFIYTFHGTGFHQADSFPTHVCPIRFQVPVVLIGVFYTSENRQLLSLDMR